MQNYLFHEPLKKEDKHDHEGHDHDHNHADARYMDKKILKISFIMTFSMMLIQFIYSLLSGSLALLSDTLHMFSDVFALGLSFLAIIATQKWQNEQKTFGYFRLEVLVAFINALTIVLSALFIIYEAVEKLINPSEIDAKTMIIVAICGFLVNGINALMMFKSANLDNVNMKSAFLHMMSDLLGSVVVIVGGIVVYFTGFVFVDTILAMILSFMLLRWSLKLLKQSTNVLLESSPIHIDEVKEEILKEEKISEIIDIHITQITSKMLVATMHLGVRVKDLAEFEELAKRLSHTLLDKFEIGHTTIQPLFKEKK
ncbi:cation transporter [Campylobacter sp. MIT 99-7217]|uniref:cation diffusion facilitator family transporter n=1 Tax=Campylobacter sp. MIT 99-7217 TaxID=535091 RepID=UPI00115981AB|nr:cation diffusion facilitator family transporter [Campylobacter sp. MIT 99-7217]TQR32441.1 cation transporter [Campylobacter sp. MIT 99-7217]